jgi:hypothetical protein
MFRFTSRDVLWLTVVVALAVGWGVDRVQFCREQVNARRAELSARMEAQRAQENAELARAMERAAAAKLQATSAP